MLRSTCGKFRTALMFGSSKVKATQGQLKLCDLWSHDSLFVQPHHCYSYSSLFHVTLSPHSHRATLHRDIKSTCLTSSTLPSASVYYSSSVSSQETNDNLVQTTDNLQSGRKQSSKRVSKNKQRQEIEREFQQIVADKGDAYWTSNDWVSLAENLSPKVRGPWENLCMHTLYKDKNIAVGRSLMEFLETKTQAPNEIVLTFYIGLLGATSDGLESQEEETKKYYDMLLSRTDVLDAASIEVLVHGLSHTKYYKECLRLLQICKESSQPGTGTLVNILNAGLRNQEAEICSLILAELEAVGEPERIVPFANQIINQCLEVNNQHGLQMVMDLMQKQRVLLPRNCLDAITDSFYRHQPSQWDGRYGYIHYKSGACVVCGHQMERIEISDEEFKQIQTAFLDQVIVGENIFYKTSPEEVKDFVKYVKNKGPFDVVIDGLNVIFRGPGGRRDEKLVRTIEHFMSEGKKVLVLGSQVLIPITSKLKHLSPRPCMYFTSSTRTDDVFFLYAALHSGKNTLIVSRDKMRDHKFLLQPNLRQVFLHWVMMVQIHDWFFTRDKQFVIKKRNVFNLGPTQDGGGWHIPEMDMDAEHPFGNFSVLCLRDKTKQTVVHRNDFNERDDIIKPRRQNQMTPSNYRDRKAEKVKPINITKEWFES